MSGNLVSLQISSERLEEMRNQVREDGKRMHARRDSVLYRSGIANGFEWLYAELTGKEPDYINLPTACVKTKQQTESQELDQSLLRIWADTKFNTRQHPDAQCLKTSEPIVSDSTKQSNSQPTEQSALNKGAIVVLAEDNE